MDPQGSEPRKPFACNIADCGMSFTNEDHLNVHTKKHDMVLQLGTEQKAFVADQTPTPTRFIRNCEEVGLFADLQHVNPFDEGFKRAMETKAGMLSLEAAMGDDVLHTPQMVFPLTEADSMYTTTNNHKNITISRSSSDENGAIKEYETTTISKLTNQVTTISRVIERQDSNEDPNKNDVSYRNNIIKIHSNVEIRKDQVNLDCIIPVFKDAKSKDVMLSDNQLTVLDKLPMMSQKSIDNVVDNFVNDTVSGEVPAVTKNVINNSETEERNNDIKDSQDYEVIIKLPNKKYIKMRAVEELIDAPKTDVTKDDTPKEKLKYIIQNKVKIPQNPLPVIQSVRSEANEVHRNNIKKDINNTNMVELPHGSLIPVAFINPNTAPIILTNQIKIPIPLEKNAVNTNARRRHKKKVTENVQDETQDGDRTTQGSVGTIQGYCVERLERRSAASKRYRDKLKTKMEIQKEENKVLKAATQKLKAENAALKYIIVEHLKICPSSKDLSNIGEQIQKTMEKILEDSEVI